MKNSQPVDEMHTLEEVSSFQSLDAICAVKTKVRDAKKSEKKNIKKKLTAYYRQRKLDPTSVPNEIEHHSKKNGLDQGAAFGGNYNGKVARKVMENLVEIYEGVHDILKNRGAPDVKEECIDDFCDTVTVVMMDCHPRRRTHDYSSYSRQFSDHVGISISSSLPQACRKMENRRCNQICTYLCTRYLPR